MSIVRVIRVNERRRYSETDIAGPALAGEAFDVPAVSEERQKFLSGQRLGTERLL